MVFSFMRTRNAREIVCWIYSIFTRGYLLLETRNSLRFICFNRDQRTTPDIRFRSVWMLTLKTNSNRPHFPWKLSVVRSICFIQRRCKQIRLTPLTSHNYRTIVNSSKPFNMFSLDISYLFCCTSNVTLNSVTLCNLNTSIRLKSWKINIGF